MRKYMVIGGAGYIGSHMTKLLCDNGESVVVVDNLSTGKAKLVDERATLVVCDIRNKEELSKVFEVHDIDGIYHFAADSQVGESMLNPIKYYNNNVGGLITLLEVMEEYKVRNIVFSSTAAVYGEKEIMPIKVDDSTNPTNPYGETKLAMEKIFKWVSKSSDINYAALRYFNVAGADSSGTIGELHDPETHLIPIIIDVALGNREKISIYGDDYPTEDGTCIRDYIHVSDLVNAHLLAMNHIEKENVSNTYNLGYGHGYSVKEIIESVERVTGTTIKSEVEGRRAGDPAELVADNEKIVRTLDWQPKFNDIDLIIGSAYKFHKNNK